MTLHPGARLGSYEIVGPLGAAGMGEVYGAADSNLGRQVAIKVLPAVVASDRERLARFDREARTLAAPWQEVAGLEACSGGSGDPRIAKTKPVDLSWRAKRCLQ